MATSETPHIDKERFLGRDEALEAVLTGFREAIKPGSRSPRVCLIEGPPGVGKEHLLGELIGEALDEGANVLEAGEGSRSLGGMLPFMRTAVALGEGLVSTGLLETIRSCLDDSASSGDATLGIDEVVEIVLSTTTTPTVFIVLSAHLQDPLTQNCLLSLLCPVEYE